MIGVKPLQQEFTKIKHDKKLLATSYKFYWGGIADFKGLLLIKFLTSRQERASKFPTKLICNVIRHIHLPN
jgi:hypothetical protein